jgi:hypothetical protein
VVNCSGTCGHIKIICVFFVLALFLPFWYTGCFPFVLSPIKSGRLKVL